MEPTAEQLKELKRVELEMLKAFIAICEHNHLHYYVVGGTLLGAVRHKGFIPWDDDIDVAMPREDYDKFLEIGQAFLPEGLFLQTRYTDSEMPINFAKIRDDRTTFIEKSVRNYHIHHGAYIDVFPLDYCPEKGLLSKVLFLKNRLLVTRIGSFFFNEHTPTLKQRFFKLVAYCYCPNARKALDRRERFMISQHKGAYVMNWCGAWEKKEHMPASWFEDGVLLNFEGLQVMAPKEYEKYLTKLYGDFMQVPPIEQRKGHHYTEVVDLETPYTSYFFNQLTRR